MADKYLYDHWGRLVGHVSDQPPRQQIGGCLSACVLVFLVTFAFRGCPGPPTSGLKIDESKLLGTWQGDHSLITYAPDHTYSVIDPSTRKVLEHGTWSTSGDTLEYVRSDYWSGSYHITRLDGQVCGMANETMDNTPSPSIAEVRVWPGVLGPIQQQDLQG